MTALAGAALVTTGAWAAKTGWSSATSPNGVFSVSTPCSASEIAAARRIPASVIPAVKISPQARVLCRKDKLLLVAGEVAEPSLPASAPSLLDQVSAAVRADATAEGVASSTRIAGRRAFRNRQQQGGGVAEIGVVEVSRTKVVLLMAGVEPGTRLSSADRNAVVDRFFGSVRIAGK